MALTDNLVSYYKFDETSGIILNDAHGPNDGTIDGCTINQPGIIDKAADFDGIDDDIYNFGDVFGYSGNMTWNFWIKTSQTGVGRIISKDDGTNRTYISYINVGNVSWVAWFGGVAKNATSAGTVNDGAWHMITLMHDGNDLKIYIDGLLDGSNIGAGATMDTDPANYVFGYRPATNGERYDGLLDEVGMWNKALSTTEISDLYNSRSGLAYPFSLGWANKIFGIVPGKIIDVDVSNIASVIGIS